MASGPVRSLASSCSARRRKSAQQHGSAAARATGIMPEGLAKMEQMKWKRENATAAQQQGSVARGGSRGGGPPQPQQRAARGYDMESVI